MDERLFNDFRILESRQLKGRQLLSLENICIDAIRKNFKYFLSVVNKEENYKLKFVLQRMYTNAFFQKLKSKLKKSYQSFFINQHFRTLDLNYFHVKASTDILKMLKNNGEGIRCLRFSEFERSSICTKEFSLEFVDSLPSSLTSLTLNGLKCSNDILKIVMKTCCNLQELNLRFCVDLCTDGIRAAFEDQPMNTILLKFNVEFTAVCKEGLSLVLDHCPNIRELNSLCLSSTLSEIYEHHMDNNIFPIRKYKLQVLHVHSKHLKACQLMCPNAHSLIVRGLTQNESSICNDFKHLRNVQFEFALPLSLTSFLEARGPHLERLIIRGEATICLEPLIKFCPKLEYIELSAKFLNMRNSLHFDFEKMSLTNLKTLIIKDVNIPLKTRYINTLLSHSPNIETLMFGREISSAAIEELSILNSLSRLSRICIFCSDVDIVPVKKIIAKASNLKYLLIRYCDRIPLIEANSLRRFARKRNVKIRLRNPQPIER